MAPTPSVAFATARLLATRPAPAGPYHVELEVWSHSYDDPDPVRRSAAVTGVYLTHLANAPGYSVSNLTIADQYGVDHAKLWQVVNGAGEVGFYGYAEYDTQGVCGHGLPSVFWSSLSGVYDERCLADINVDRLRLQTHRPTATQVGIYNYIRGPLVFAFDVVLPSTPTAVHLKLGLVGGNGGNPAQHTATQPDENFIIEFP